MSLRSDPATGVKPFTIAGRLVEVRERCWGMTDEERRWRAQWLKDQILSPDEPRDVPEYYKETNHFIRRLWKTPMHKFQKALTNRYGHNVGFFSRHILGKGIISISLIYTLTYMVKYHSSNFETFRTIDVLFVRGRMYPGYPNYPHFPVKKPYEYYDDGFYSSVLCQKVTPKPPIVVHHSKPKKPPPPKIVVQEVIQEEEEVVCVLPEADN